ncbi:50S ribosomal protein L11 methyltransferase [Gallaecimonas mangrovi]|uniref:50S ribosomal protein L11 methyltransferase n=1 Tax=Gallaecimonas mangrovi TaxID=2291597 RepID=UPI000E203CF0|nr:50S ribosomal protein L11 methyltransferase [Gallaecimonas mangrovi]
MSWIQVRTNTNAQLAEKLGDLLMEQGALSITFMDAKDTPVFEPLPGETRLWGDTDLMALFTADADTSGAKALIKTLLGEDTPIKIEVLEDKDWERAWMDNFHPMQFGKRLWICPTWLDVPDPSAVNVRLDPGLAFGTGTHATTALCLEWLDGQDLSGKTVVDFGCGSGILAIAALKLGAKRVVGVDIDPQAIEASLANATRNDVAEQLELYLPKDQPIGLQADVVVANILAGPLHELRDIILGYLKPGGVIALSGILESQAPALSAFYGEQCQMDPIVEREEWCRVAGKKF